MIDKDLLDRYLAGKGTPEDRATLVKWFSSLDDGYALRRASLAKWEEEGTRMEASRAASLLDRINHMIRLQERPAAVHRRSQGKFIRVLTRIAAVLFIPLVISLWLLRDNILPAGSEPVSSQIVCPPGTRVMFHLPDGSSGWLNGGSTLEYPTRFKGKVRNVKLAGEGFFNVESSQRKPFRVTANSIHVSAKGTQFNVRAYPGSGLSDVTLVEGIVELSRTRSGRVEKLGDLKPGQVFSADDAGSRMHISTADVEKRTAWKDGKLIFRDDNFRDLVRMLNRWYNMNIIILDKELESYAYVGTFQDETLEEVLKLLALTSPIQYRDLGRARRDDGTFEMRTIELRFKK